MKNKKVFCLLLSIAVLLCVAVPGTFAIAAYATDEGAAAEMADLDEPNADNEEVIENENSENESLDEEISDEPIGDDVIADDEDAPIHETADSAAEDVTPSQEVEKSLFDRLMATETIDELFAIVDETPEEDLLALTDEENAQIEAHIEAIEPQPLPAVVIDEEDNQPVPSEIVQGTVNFSNVAPLLDPVVGEE